MSVLRKGYIFLSMMIVMLLITPITFGANTTYGFEDFTGIFGMGTGEGSVDMQDLHVYAKEDVASPSIVQAGKVSNDPILSSNETDKCLYFGAGGMGSSGRAGYLEFSKQDGSLFTPISVDLKANTYRTSSDAPESNPNIVKITGYNESGVEVASISYTYLYDDDYILDLSFANASASDLVRNNGAHNGDTLTFAKSGSFENIHTLRFWIDYDTLLLDDLVLSSDPPLPSAPSLTVDTSDNTVDHDLTITFTPDATYQGAITDIKVGDSSLDSSQYAISGGTITLKPSVDTGSESQNALLRTPGSKTIKITATDYTEATVTQVIHAGTAKSLTITTEPVPGTASGDAFATQPVVTLKDQYDNICATGPSATSTVTAEAKAGTGTWTIGGTSSKSAVGGVVTYTNLTCTLSSQGTGQINFVLGTLNDNASQSFTIPMVVPPSLTVDTSDNTVDHDLTITFTPDATYQGAITDIKVGDSSLDSSQYAISGGTITLKPSVDTGSESQNALLRTPGSKTIKITATDYTEATVTQVIHAGTAKSLTITTEPVPGTASGDVFATQPVVTLKDQYDNICATGPSATSTVTAEAKAGTGTWTIGGTSSKSAVGGVVTYTNLTCTLSSQGTGQINFVLGTLNDNASQSFTIPMVAPPSLTVDTSDNTVDHDLTITFTPDATYQGAITDIKVGDSSLDSSQYAISGGTITLKPSVDTGSESQNALLRTPGSKTIKITATDYTEATVTQVIHAGTAKSLTITTEPVPGTASGDAFATQPVVTLKDQYDNICATGPSATSTVTAEAKAGTGTWTIGGTSSKSAVGGVVTYTNLTCTLSSQGTGQINFVLGTLNDNASQSFTIPMVAPPSLTVDTSDNTVDHDLTITFTPDATYQGAITDIKVGDSSLDSSQYAISGGTITLKPSVDTGSESQNALLRTPGSKTIKITATDYTEATVTQVIHAGTAKSLTITTEPVPGTASGDAFATQPVVTLKDQYDNICATGPSATSTVTAEAKAGTGTWTIGGTSSKSAVGGVVTYTNLTCTLSSQGTGQINFVLGTLNDNVSQSFTIPMVAPPSLTVDTSDNTVDHDLTITFTPDATYQGAITDIKVGDSSLDLSQYAISGGTITLKPSVDTGSESQNALLRTPGSKTIKITATDYTEATVTQVIKWGAIDTMTFMQTLSAPASLSSDFSRQPIVQIVDQYENLIKDDNGTMIRVEKSDNGDWTLTGTLEISSVNGVFAFTDLGVTNTRAVNSAKIKFTSSIGILESAIFNIPGASQPNDSNNNTDNQTGAGNDENDDIIVNGEVVKMGQSVIYYEDNKRVNSVKIDEAKFDELLNANFGTETSMIIPVSSKDSEISEGVLTGEMVKKLEDRRGTLEIQTDFASYALPALEFNMDQVQNQLGADVNFENIEVKVKIAEASEEEMKIVTKSAAENEYTLIVPAVDFSIECSYEDTIVDVDLFNHYVKRSILIPEGINPSQITTGIVVEKDGTSRHVPTKVVEKEGQYYAEINSLTNSLYSVVWHPMDYVDSEGHWAESYIDNMGSRMIVEGATDDTFSPESRVTRAEFIVSLVKALGLGETLYQDGFKDVNSNATYATYVETANEYGLIDYNQSPLFIPDDFIIRSDAFEMIAEAMDIIDLSSDLSISEVEHVLSEFSDIYNMDEAYKKGIADVIAYGIVSGTCNHQLELERELTKAEMATILNQLLVKSNLIERP